MIHSSRLWLTFLAVLIGAGVVIWLSPSRHAGPTDPAPEPTEKTILEAGQKEMTTKEESIRGTETATFALG
jgi:hypothetical protein